MSFHFDASLLTGGLLDFNQRAQTAIRMYAETSALKLQNDARSDAPWTDRTAHARQRLTGDVLISEKGYTIRLSHGVNYGKWLELAHEKKYAIIKPTIDKDSPEIIKGLQNLLKKL